MIREYEKMETPFKRDDKTKKLNENEWRNETVEYLKNLQWNFTEKIDGTNIRVYWNGHKVNFYGRTDKAQIPANLTNKLLELFGGNVNEEMFEQKFGDKEVMLIGEGYGAKIQSGGNYIPDGVDFALFDVFIDGIYLSREAVKDIANYFNINTVPDLGNGTLQEAIDFIKTKPKSKIGKADMEGIVARPIKELYDKRKERIIVKIKACDFNE